MAVKYKSKNGKYYATQAEATKADKAWDTAIRLEAQTRSIPRRYIGGNSNEARAKFWKTEPVINHAVDSIAGEYGINPELLRYRLDREGFTDNAIRINNEAVKTGENTPRGYAMLHSNDYDGISSFGLDDAGTYINQGKAKLINENWYEEEYENEKGRRTLGATGETLSDNIGITASMLQMFRNQAKKDYPNASTADLDRYAAAYYNRGAAGGKQWVKNGAKGYNIKQRSLEDAGRTEYKDGGIYIKPSKRGTFTAAATKHGMGVQAFASKVLANKENYSPAMVKKANFARNASKWN